VSGDNVDKDELLRTGIGLLTIGHEAVVEGMYGTVDTASLRAAYEVLRKNLTDFRMKFPGIPADSLDDAYDAVMEVADMYAKRMDLVVFGMLKGFMEVTRAYLEDCPDADIGAILQDAALHLPA
jgi:hypothetical protein